jgi:predicted PurR-regulated permease PerM
MGLLLLVIILYPVVSVALILRLVRPSSSQILWAIVLAIALTVSVSWFVGRADEYLWEGVVSALLSLVALVGLGRCWASSRAARRNIEI